jgi:hypothetical protein
VNAEPSIDNGYGRWVIVERDSPVTSARFHVCYADTAPGGAVASFHRREDAEQHMRTLTFNTCSAKAHLHSCDVPRGMRHTFHNCKCGAARKDGETWPMQDEDLCWFLDRPYSSAGYREEIESA